MGESSTATVAYKLDDSSGINVTPTPGKLKSVAFVNT